MLRNLSRSADLATKVDSWTSHLSFVRKSSLQVTIVKQYCTAWCNEIGSLTSLMHVTQVHPVTAGNQFHCTRLYSQLLLPDYCSCCGLTGFIKRYFTWECALFCPLNTCLSHAAAIMCNYSNYTNTHTHTHTHTHTSRALVCCRLFCWTFTARNSIKKKNRTWPTWSTLSREGIVTSERKWPPCRSPYVATRTKR